MRTEKKKYYSTADVGRFCGVHISTVIRWVNRGKLPAARTPGGVRRIAPRELALFMRQHDYPIPPELQQEADGVQADETGNGVEFYRQVVGNANEAIIGFDASAKLILFNRRAEALSGYSREETLASGFLEKLLPDEDQRAKALDSIAAHQRGEKVGDALWVIRSKSGEDLSLNVSSRAIAGSDGVFRAAICGWTDVTDSDWLRRKLRESNDFLDSVIENSPFSLQIVNREGSTVKINRAFSRAFRISEDQIVGEGVHNFFKDERLRQTGLAAAVEKAFGGEVVRVPFAEFHGNDGEGSLEGSETVVRAVAFPIAEGEEVSCVGIVYEDITEKAMLQRELISKNSEMETFVYTVAHDLKSPLGVISSCAQFLRDGGAGSEDASKHIGMIMRSADRMREFIDGLLSLSRAGRWDEGRVYETAVAAIVKEIVLEMRVRFPEKKFRLSTGDLPVINLQPDAAKQLFQNLITNAHKYRHSERVPEISVDCRMVGGVYRFSVRDNGIGIAPHDRKRVFDVFYRSAGAGGEGSGVGLSIVRRIVERAGGKIWVESAPGKGSTFFFTIPR